MARAGSAGGKAQSRGAGKARGQSEAKRAAEQSAGWVWAAVAVILGAMALRLGVNSLALVPIHFDEAQYWAYGQELAWGYYSKPPLVGGVIRVATEIGGDTTVAMRVPAPVCHALTAGLLFLLGRGLFDARTGFWAAAAYTAAPGVTASSMIVSTDPVMMVAWAGGLYAWVRAAETGDRRWWAAMGVAIGLGFLAKYTILAFAAGALGYALFSARSRGLTGPAIAVLAAALVAAPNLLWNAANDFATLTHVAEDADPGTGYFRLDKFAEFIGAQFGVIGPVVFAAMGVALWYWRDWVGDWRMRLLAWQAFALLGAMIGLAVVTRAQPNWAAPAYLAGTLFAVRWMLMADWRRGLRLQLGFGAAAAVAIWGLAWAYGSHALALPRGPDPFKKMRLSEPFCELALGAMAEEGVAALLSNDRRRLSECMFLGGLGWDEIAVWNPDGLADNHHELVSALRPGDRRPMLLAVLAGADAMTRAFEQARPIDEGRFRTHADRDFPYALWVVEGFRGYDHRP
ncbi:MAG: glycosyltransferase family 39 protein [Pseudomonadota bacterium]